MDFDMEKACKWPKALKDMFDVVSESLRLSGRPEKSANDDAYTAVKALAQYFGGRMFYLPTGKTLDLSLRNEMIWREFSGSNVADLSKRYNLTEQAVYRILADMRKQGRENAAG